MSKIDEGGYYLVDVTLRIPSRFLNKLSKRAIRSQDVSIVSADWGNVRGVWKDTATIKALKEGGE